VLTLTLLLLSRNFIFLWFKSNKQQKNLKRPCSNTIQHIVFKFRSTAKRYSVFCRFFVLSENVLTWKKNTNHLKPECLRYTYIYIIYVCVHIIWLTHTSSKSIMYVRRVVVAFSLSISCFDTDLSYKVEWDALVLV